MLFAPADGEAERARSVFDSERDSQRSSSRDHRLQDQLTEAVVAAQKEFGLLKQKLLEAQQELTKEEGAGTELEVRLAETRRQQDEVANQVVSLRKAALKAHLERRQRELARMMSSCSVAGPPCDNSLTLRFSVGAQLLVTGLGVGKWVASCPTATSQGVLEAKLAFEKDTGCGVLQQLETKQDMSLTVAPGLGRELCILSLQHVARTLDLQPKTSSRQSASAQQGTPKEFILLVPRNDLRQFVQALDAQLRNLQAALTTLLNLRKLCKDVMLVSARLEEGALKAAVTLEVIRSPELSTHGQGTAEVDAARCVIEFSPQISASAPGVSWSCAKVCSTLGWHNIEQATEILSACQAGSTHLQDILARISDAIRCTRA
mmetsp:Transcript_924/g.2109  ORF Transcript_924/g.2109 Transcript_924/m.2109 type:complete len:376 (+) Transcript_924:564-1691(+)